MDVRERMGFPAEGREGTASYSRGRGDGEEGEGKKSGGDFREAKGRREREGTEHRFVRSFYTRLSLDDCAKNSKYGTGLPCESSRGEILYQRI